MTDAQDETPFVWRGKTLETIGDLRNAMNQIYEIESQMERADAAAEFMATYRSVNEYADAHIGYLCGYHGRDTMVAMLRLFRTAHPVFGPPALADKVTPEGAFEAGKVIGERMRETSQS